MEEGASCANDSGCDGVLGEIHPSVEKPTKSRSQQSLDSSRDPTVEALHHREVAVRNDEAGYELDSILRQTQTTELMDGGLDLNHEEGAEHGRSHSDVKSWMLEVALTELLFCEVVALEASQCH